VKTLQNNAAAAGSLAFSAFVWAAQFCLTASAASKKFIYEQSHPSTCNMISRVCRIMQTITGTRVRADKHIYDEHAAGPVVRMEFEIQSKSTTYSSTD
jgi:hypothetical protein